MKLKTLAAVLIGFMASMAVAVSVALILFSTSFHTTSSQLLESNLSVSAAQNLETELLLHAHESLLWERTKDIEHLRNRRLAQENVVRLFDESKRHISSSEEAALVRSAQDSVTRYFDERIRLEGEGLNEPDIVSQITPAIDDALQSLRQVSQLNASQAQAAHAASAQFDLMADVFGGVIALFVLSVVPFLFFLLRRSVYKPMQLMVQAIRNYREGKDLGPTINGVAEIRDVSVAFSELVEEIKRQRESRSRYLSAVAHDLRNPIGAIKMSADLIIEEYGNSLPTELMELLNVAQRQANHLERMTSDLLDTMRIEGGLLQIQMVNCDLRSIIYDCCELFRNYSREHRILFTANSDCICAHADPSRMAQVFNNLISNAIKYSPYGGEVVVSLTTESGFGVLKVKDSGIGIPVSELESIFEPFRRASITRDTIPGVGLGLFTAKKIVEGHGGRIEIVSEMGFGSTFIVAIPLSIDERAGRSDLFDRAHPYVEPP